MIINVIVSLLDVFNVYSVCKVCKGLVSASHGCKDSSEVSCAMGWRVADCGRENAICPETSTKQALGCGRLLGF